MKKIFTFRHFILLSAGLLIMAFGCIQQADKQNPLSQVEEKNLPKPGYTLTKDQTHNKFSSKISAVLTVPSGAIIEAFTKEASNGQVTPATTVEELPELDFDPIHPLTGPVYVEGAEPGDVLAVTLHQVEVGNYGWNSISPGFGFLADEFKDPFLKIFQFEKGDTLAIFSENIRIPLRPFPGVMGVAPAEEEMLTTIPPRANGGNMDDPHMVAGTTVYFPVFVEGAMFSIGDVHAAQGLGEVCGAAIEIPARIIYEVNVIKNKKIAEPEYETNDYYAVTAFGKTIDEAAKKAVGYMINHLVNEHGMDRTEAYALCSLAGDLKTAEVVDVPHMLVTMHMPKNIFIK